MMILKMLEQTQLEQYNKVITVILVIELVVISLLKDVYKEK